MSDSGHDFEQRTSENGKKNGKGDVPSRAELSSLFFDATPVCCRFGRPQDSPPANVAENDDPTNRPVKPADSAAVALAGCFDKSKIK